MFDRRAVIGMGLGGLGTGLFPRIAFAAAPTDRRFVFIIQRGAADGLDIVAPMGDPAYAGLRGGLAQGVAGGRKLDGLFTLHPALARLGGFYAAGQALFCHAVASAYRDRSHFDGQNVLETGGRLAFAEKSGWMNRLVGLLPKDEAKGLAVAPAIPMAMRGPVQVESYAPSNLKAASDDLMMRVSALYAEDRQLDPLWRSALATRKLTGDIAVDDGRNAAAIGSLAARLMTPADGARVVMIESGGWDTHSGQVGRLAAQLRGLDALVGAMADGLGPVWRRTMVLVATEFGRTAAVNGTGGTDHGTGAVAMLAGGAVRGGRVMADWPGLGVSALYQGRDLKPTLAVEALVCGAVAGHFGLDPARVAAGLYPAQPGLRPVTA